MKDCYLYGASGHAKVVSEIVTASGGRIMGLFDDNPHVEELSGIPVMHAYHGESPLLISIGSNRVRYLLANRLKGGYATAIHPLSILSPCAGVGSGTVVMPGAIINAGAIIGHHCIINTGASIDHDSRLGDYVHVSPHATLCGNVTVGEGTWIGAGSVVIQGVRIGRWSVIGAGSVVTKDIPDGCLAVGHPCKPIRMINQELLTLQIEMGGVNMAPD